MKIYEKPMAIIEKINCEDVMTTSPVVAEASEEAYTALKAAAGNDVNQAIIFEW